ncbi:MAG: formate--tetrahydrofolate ligase [Spirochaetia bacterium]|jgi:formate--tetrahydrofolate ligase|nr:formate--tetrahydrofolate ligase [Spirochaetia bacterium]
MGLVGIEEVARSVGIDQSYLIHYGNYKAKVDNKIYSAIGKKQPGKLVLVTSITPTKAGEGKTTASIALADGLSMIGEKAMLCLREPSMGPVFGLKGGATGGGKASIGPEEDINLHFTGDMHALTSSINLIAAVLDNSIYQGNPLHIDPDHIVWSRAMDMNDRELRNITVGQGKGNGIEHKGHFVITVASELMAILCLSLDAQDFYRRIRKIIVAYTYDGQPVTLADLRVSHAVMKLMKDALLPNLVQTLEHNPVFVHGGPFANIAHGCSSISALHLAMQLAPITITEAGFGADLGAEKFMDICCRVAGTQPVGAVVVATVKALKMHGGVPYEELDKENVAALLEGTCNLKAHVEAVRKFGVPVVIAINHFEFDTQAEVDALSGWCTAQGYEVAFLDGFAKGGAGAIDLAKKVVSMLAGNDSQYRPLYELDWPVKKKIETIAKEIYGAGKVIYTEQAERQLAKYHEMGLDDLYICMAKTPSSLTDNPKILGAPKGFAITVREVLLSAGAGFLIPMTGKVLTMPGLNAVPAAVQMEEEPLVGLDG